MHIILLVEFSADDGHHIFSIQGQNWSRFILAIAKICIILELFLITHTAAAQIPAAEDHRRIS